MVFEIIVFVALFVLACAALLLFCLTSAALLTQVFSAKTHLPSQPAAEGWSARPKYLFSHAVKAETGSNECETKKTLAP